MLHMICPQSTGVVYVFKPFFFYRKLYFIDEKTIHIKIESDNKAKQNK